MYCPKCGVENPDNAKICSSCSWVLTSTSTSAPNPDTKTSGLAIASFVLGILSVLFTIFTAIPAIILGIISLVKISRSAGRLKGKGFAIAGIAIPAAWLPLLTVLFIPAFINVRVMSEEVKQKAQFVTLDLALVAFKNDYGDYPPSWALDDLNQSYCGVQKLAEALLGKDLMGFHPASKFRRDGTDNSGKSLYVPATVDARRGPYLELGSANVYRLQDVFEDVGPFDGNSFVICDVYTKKRHSGKKTGMPILYYRANISSKTMDTGEPMDKRIYNAEDNLAIVQLARTRGGGTHPLADNGGKFFYDKGYKIIDPSITSRDWPHNADSYILISAGNDGLYGTKDDITNFARE